MKILLPSHFLMVPSGSLLERMHCHCPQIGFQYASGFCTEHMKMSQKKKKENAPAFRKTLNCLNLPHIAFPVGTGISPCSIDHTKTEFFLHGYSSPPCTSTSPEASSVLPTISLLFWQDVTGWKERLRQGDRQHGSWESGKYRRNAAL